MVALVKKLSLLNRVKHSIFRFLDKYLVLQLHKSAFVQMMWRMLVEQPDIIRSLKCWETSVLEITSKKKQSSGHGSCQQ